MTIPASQLDAVVAFLAERERHIYEIQQDVANSNLQASVPYMVQKLCKEGRIERTRIGFYRAVPAKVDGEAP